MGKDSSLEGEEQYLKEWRKITPYLTGEDLGEKEFPGPIYKILKS